VAAGPGCRPERFEVVAPEKAVPMGIAEMFGYDGKRALVVGGATGMGAATAQIARDLGAEVVVMDYADVSIQGVKGIKVDLRDKASIDAALDECGGPIHALFSCAGVADGAPRIMHVNFIGQRHLIERAVKEDMMPKGSAIAMISSVAGLGWENNLPTIMEFLDTPDFEAATAWIDAHPDLENYSFSKQAILAYVAHQGYPFVKRGVRINAIQPGPTDTPLARANADVWLGFAADYRADCGVEASTPEEQGAVLAFLCCDAASHVNGISIITDAGYVSAALTDAYEGPFIKVMLGRA
jgi:NAD(P)-dependent dehydrogenase (short-subunit alcohol dehydrogenase family)